MGREPADQVDLERRGHVEAGDSRRNQIADHRLVGVRLDRIGHQPRKPGDEFPRPLLQHLGGKDQHRVFRLQTTDDLGGVVPDGRGRLASSSPMRNPFVP